MIRVMSWVQMGIGLIAAGWACYRFGVTKDPAHIAAAWGALAFVEIVSLGLRDER